MLSPMLFSVYLDDLILQLRRVKLGCHIGGLWMGACGYADDLVLLAPVRSVLSEHNLVFSTDPVPAKSKSKSIFFCGRMNELKSQAHR